MILKGIISFILVFNLSHLGLAQKNWQEALIQGKYRQLYRQFSPEVKKSLSYRDFKSSINNITSIYGEFIDINEQNGSKGIFRLLTPSAALQLFYARDDNHITRFYIRPYSYEQPQNARHIRLFRERHDIVVNDTQHLDALLWLPDGVQKPPVVVMVHGSGPMDMDETVGPNKTFLDLAYALAEQGIATFRYEKRTKAYPEWMHSDSLGLEEETIEDALKALQMLKLNPLVDSTSIWVLGHSLGGYALPEIINRSCFVAGGIILGGNSRPVHELVTEQIEFLSSRDGKISPDERRVIRKAKKISHLVSERNWSRLDKALQKSADLYYWPLKFFRETSAYDPVQKLRESCSKATLVIQGGRDYQVDKSNFTRWKAVNQQQVAFRFIPEANHLFMSGEGPPGPSEYFISARVDARVSEYITEFIRNPEAFFNKTHP